MSIEAYSPTRAERVNPEFIGIAKKHSSYKQKRRQLQNERDNCLRALKFKMSVDLALQKGLEQQRDKLQTSKKVRGRRRADQEFRREHDDLLRSNLRSLSSSVRERREDLRQGIKKSVFQLFSRKRNSCLQEKEFHEKLEKKLRSTQHQMHAENQKRFREVKLGERHSQNTVNRFYKTINKDSLNTYQNWITDETNKSNQYSEQIELMENVMSKLDQQIEKKKDKMLHIFQKIEGYTLESTVEQSKCLPVYLRSNLSTSSHSSRPKDILLKKGSELQKLDRKLLSTLV